MTYTVAVSERLLSCKLPQVSNKIPSDDVISLN